MVKCSECGKQNTLDSRFCRACGTEVPAVVAAEAREANERLVAEGRRLLVEGRTAEAKLLAETTHENDPSSANALSLLGECHERYGHYEQALECYERVLELQPDSALERIKIEHLRKVIVGQPAVAEEPAGVNRRAIGAAIAAVVLVASIGAVFGLNGDKAKAETKSTQPTSAVHSTMPPVEAMPKSSVPIEAEPVPPRPAADEGEEEPAAREDAPARREPERTAPTRPQPRQSPPEREPTRQAQPAPDPRKVAAGPTLPAPTPNGERVNPNDGGYRPMSPGNTRITVSREDPPKPPAKLADPPKKTGADADPKPFNPGMIDIRPSQDSPRQIGGSETIRENENGGMRRSPTRPAADPNAGVKGAQALMKVAQQHMLTRNFAAAADAYEKAIRAGASPTTAYQRLGQCYQAMGRRTEAIGAYSKAIRAMESAAASDRSVAERMQVSIDACKKAIAILGG